MKHIKPYEYFEIKLGDWILYEDTFIPNKDLKLFTTTTPGKVIHIEVENKSIPKKLKYHVEYKFIPKNLKWYFGSDDFLYVYKDEIIAKMSEEEANVILDSKKYNL